MIKKHRITSTGICPGIVNYMIEQSKPPSKAITSVKNARNILHHASDVTIIACFSGEDDSNLDVYQDAGECR